MFFLNTAFNQIINQFFGHVSCEDYGGLTQPYLKLSGIYHAFKTIRSELVIFHLLQL